MGTDLEVAEIEEEDAGLTERQVQALEKLHSLGAEMAEPGPDGKMIYSPDPQVRAYQMIAEGKIGGPGRGQGRKRKPRAAQKVAEEVRKEADLVVKAIKRGLNSDNERTALSAAEMALKIERDETLLSLKEEEVDSQHETKEELLDALIQLVSDPEVEAQLEASFTLPDSEVTDITYEDNTGDISDAEVVGVNGTGAARNSEANGTHAGTHRGDVRGADEGSRPNGKNPWTKASRRRSTD